MENNWLKDLFIDEAKQALQGGETLSQDQIDSAVEKYLDENPVQATEDAVLYTSQVLTDEQKTQVRENISAVSIEEVEAMIGGEEDAGFSETGDLVELNVEAETPLCIISKIHRDETWGESNKLVLHQVSGSNFVDLTAYLGGVGKVFEKNGLTATINANSTVTISGTNEHTSYTYIIDKSYWSGVHSTKVYPAGTYTIPKGFILQVRAAQHPEHVTINGIGNISGTVTIPESFKIVSVRYPVGAGNTVDAILPLGLFRGNPIPEIGYEYSGNLHTVTFDAPVYDGEFNWLTGELKDVNGNTVTYYDVPEIKSLPGTNYFWTCFGENTVSDRKDDGKIILRLNEPAPEDTIPSICDFILTPTTPEAAYGLYYAPFLGGGQFTGNEVPVMTTKGTLSVKDIDGNVKYSKYIEPMFNTRGVSDILTHKGLEKKWSGKFYLTKEPISITSNTPYDGAPVPYIFVWEFDESEFVNSGIPAKIHDIPMASPCFINNDNSENNVNTQVLWNGSPYPAFFSYNEETGKYTLTARGIKASYIKHQLTNYSKVHFYYQLETPYSLPFTFAMGIDVGDEISFEVDLTDNQPYIDALSDFKDHNLEPSIIAFIPRKIEDAMCGMTNAAMMLNTNDSSNNGDATVQGYSWIGEGDGVTDYTTKIQSKLDEFHLISNGGTIHLGPGTYPISGRLIVYSNTTIIGCGVKTIIRQTADNTDAIILNGSDIMLEDFCIHLAGVCTEITACVYANANNSAGDNGYPSNFSVTNLTMDNIFMSGGYRFEYDTDGKPILGDVYNNYKGVGIRSQGLYFNYAHIDNVHGKYLMAAVHNGGGGNYYNITSEYCKYAVYVGGVNCQYFVDGHSYYEGNQTDGYVSMSDYVVYEEGHNNKYSVGLYDMQHCHSHFYFSGKSQSNSYTINSNFASSHSGLYIGSGDKQMTYEVVDLGRGNIRLADYQHIPFAIGNHTKQLGGTSSLAISNPIILNALSGAGVWGNISSNVVFDNCGLELSEVCRYPSEKASAVSGINLPSAVSSVTASESNPVEIEIDVSNRPIYNRSSYFIQFDHRYVASDFTVAYDTTGDGAYNLSYEVKNNTNVTMFMVQHQASAHLIHRIKFTFTKPLQIENFTYQDSAFKDHTINYNPNGLIGICNIGMTVNDYAGRSFLGECGGSLYGNVDMHQNTLKNLPAPVDDGDAVSKAYLEERLAALEALIANM